LLTLGSPPFDPVRNSRNFTPSRYDPVWYIRMPLFTSVQYKSVDYVNSRHVCFKEICFIFCKFLKFGCWFKNERKFFKNTRAALSPTTLLIQRKQTNQNAPIMQKENKKILRAGESNPGRPRDRREYSPLY
jgi:hypothetical protein